MKVSSRLLLCVAAVFLWTVFVINHTASEPERDAVRLQITAMRDAITRNDFEAVAELVAPEVREAFRTQEGVEHFQTHLGIGPRMPKISAGEQEAAVVPNPRRIFGMLLGGNAVLMRKVDGRWYFTGKLSID